MAFDDCYSDPRPLVLFISILSVQSSHLALIDTLMMAYTVEMVSVERVMSCINRYSLAEPSHSAGHIQELPYDTEDAITTWINKVHARVHTKRRAVCSTRTTTLHILFTKAAFYLTHWTLFTLDLTCERRGS